MKLTKLTLSSLFFLTMSLFIGNALAQTQDPAPVVMLKNTSNQMVGELNKHLGNLKNNRPLVSSIVKRTVVPHFDLATMGQLVVGRNYWQDASATTQKQFISAFTDYAINTYSSAISSYDGETIKFYPVRGDIADKSRVQVDTDIQHKDGPPVHVQYSVLKKGSGWFIYDFSVDGVSLVQNYRSQFAGTLREGGLEKLVAQLQQHNQKNQ